jgi:hypothetical protein
MRLYVAVANRLAELAGSEGAEMGPNYILLLGTVVCAGVLIVSVIRQALHG